MRGLLGSYFLPFIRSWTRYRLGKSLHLPAKPILPSLWPWTFLATNPTISLVVSVTALPFFLFLIILWAYELMFLPCQPTSSSILCSRLPWPIFHVFTSFGLIGQHSCHVNLFYHLFPWAYLAHLLPLYLFLPPWACY